MNVSSENLCLAALCSTLSAVIRCAYLSWGLIEVVVVEQGGGKAFPNLPIKSQSFCGPTAHLRGVAFTSVAVPLLEVKLLRPAASGPFPTQVQHPSLPPMLCIHTYIFPLR